MTVPALSPGKGPGTLTGPVGYGTVRVVLVPEVARAWAIIMPLRVKLATDRPKPRSPKPFPVMVKLAGGVARSMGLGTMELTSELVPLSNTDAPPPPLKITLPKKIPPAGGVKRTVTV